MKFATKTATTMWVDKVSFQIEFYNWLRDQLQSGVV